MDARRQRKNEKKPIFLFIYFFFWLKCRGNTPAEQTGGGSRDTGAGVVE